MDANYDVKAERAVIGAILLAPDVCDDVSLIVSTDDFYVDSNRRVFKRLVEMNADAKGIDLTLLVNALRSSGELEEVGGEAYLAELMSSVPVAAHATQYARIVAEKALRRRVIDACETAIAETNADDSDIREVVARAEERIFAVNEKRCANTALQAKEILPDVYHALDAKATGDVDGTPTGFVELDRMIGGLHGSELIILAARPSMGKTALATNIADYVAVERQKPVLFFSLEMSKTEVLIRVINARARIPSQQYRYGLSSKEQENFNSAIKALETAPLYIDDTPAHTVSEIAAIARRTKRKNGLALIIVDYLSLIEPDNSKDPRQEQVAKIARRLKGLARNLNVPVLCLAQLNRQTEQSKGNRPQLSYLRESGAIEQDADVVMFVHREEYYLTKEEAEEKGLVGVADLIVAKQRNGAIGDIKLIWQSRFTLFSNPQESEEPEPETEYANDFAPYA